MSAFSSPASINSSPLKKEMKTWIYNAGIFRDAARDYFKLLSTSRTSIGYDRAKMAGVFHFQSIHFDVIVLLWHYIHYYSNGEDMQLFLGDLRKINVRHLIDLSSSY